MEKEKENRVKGLMGKRIGAILLSVLPMAIYMLLLVLLTLGSVALQADYDRVFLPLHVLSMAVAAAIMCGVLSKRTGRRLRDALSVKGFDWVLALLLFAFTWCASEVADGIVAFICSGFMTVEPNGGPATSLEIVVAILVAPVLEEIIFRYLGTEFAERYFPLPVLCVANALYFTLMHGYNLQGFANVMIFALCMVYVYLKTKNLLCLIAVHMLHNFCCRFDYGDLIFLGSPIYSEKNGFVLGSPQWILANLVAAAVCAVIYFRRYGRKDYGKRQV